MRQALMGLVVLVSVGLGSSDSWADPAQTMAAAAGMYAKRAYADAERTLLGALEEAPGEPALLHALGLSQAKQGKYGEATLSLRRALRLAPRDAAARQALNWVRAQTSSPLEETPAQTLARGLAVVPREPALWLAALLSIAATSWLLLAQRRGTGQRNALLLASAALLLAACPLASLVIRAADDGAVVLAAQAEARSGPSAADAVLFTTHAGQEVFCVESRSDWTRIVLPTGASGWLPSSTLEPIAPPG